MELGEIQKAWIKSLRENGHRQATNYLGFKTSDGEYKACCLGEALCVLNRIKGIESKFIDGDLMDGESDEELSKSYLEIGLITELGGLKNAITIDDIEHHSLSDLNDYIFTWAEIADYIEQNPENVFTKSV